MNSASTPINWAYEVRTAVQIALEEINADPNVLPNHALEVVNSDTASDPWTTLDRVSTLFDDHFASDRPFSGIVGPAFSSDALPLSWLSSLHQVPIVSYSATSTVFSDRAAYPYFFRTMPADAFMGHALSDLLQALKVNRAAFMYVDDLYGRGGLQEFERWAGGTVELSVKEGHDPNMDDGSATAAAAIEHLRTEFQHIRDGVHGTPPHAIILFTYTSLAPIIFQIAEDEGMLEDYAWFVTDNLLVSTVLEGSPELTRQMQGVVGPVPMDGLGTRFATLNATYYERRSSDHNSLFFGDGALSRSGPFAYDATWALARACDGAIREHGATAHTNGDYVLEQLLKLNMTAATVPALVFQENGDVRWWPWGLRRDGGES